MKVVYQRSSQATKNKAPTKLFLIDHDGTLCQTNDNAYDSLVAAIKEASHFFGVDTTHLEDNWNQLFSSTTGTSEKFLGKVLFYKLNIQQDQLDNFLKRFYQSRANWYANMRAHGEYVQDTYYPDALQMIEYISQSENSLLMMVTGNPSQVIEQRFASSLRRFFSNGSDELFGAFGEEAETRQDLIDIAVQKANKHFCKFEANKDDNGFIDNVYYIGDSRADFFAGLKAKVKTIWIPSRQLQAFKQVASEDSISFIETHLSEQVCISNSLESEQVIKFLDL